jgi:hypothetical protein
MLAKVLGPDIAHHRERRIWIENKRNYKQKKGCGVTGSVTPV